MMKSKWFAIMLIIVLAYRAWNFTLIVNTDVTAKAASASMATQNWQASFQLL